MANAPQKPENLRQFDAYVDENGQNMSDDPLDVARPAELRKRLNRDVGAEAEMARLASRRSSHDIADATEDVEAEVPAENIRHISDPSLGSK
jgi:hypothetical protein